MISSQPGGAPARPDADFVLLAIRENGRQRSCVIHKSEAALVMDCGWLLQPSSASLVTDFLKNKPMQDGPLRPVGYGVVAVDFERRRVTSAQGYRDLSIFGADEFGFPRHVGPFWLDWSSVLKRAFDSCAVPEAIYARPGSNARETRIEIPPAARSSASLALRFASRAKPVGFRFLGLGFEPPGWRIDNHQVTYPLLSRHMGRALSRLSKDGWMCADPVLWRQRDFR